VSAFDRTCIRWTDVQSDEIAASLAVDDVVKAKNYCKKLAGSKRNDPSCVISEFKQRQLEESCSIKFCSKLSLVMRLCVLFSVLF